MTLTNKALRVYKNRDKAIISNSSGTVTTIAEEDDDATKIHGFITTRNNADNSMYVPVADSTGYERLWKMASEITANAGGYFETLFVNTQVAVTSTMAGVARAIEAKVTVLGNMGANAEVSGLLAKVTAKGATAEVAHAIGVDVLLEEDTSGTITKGTGIRVQGGTGVITTGIDVSGVYDKGAIKLPFKTSSAIDSAGLSTAFGVTEGTATDYGILGMVLDTDDNKVYMVIMHAGVLKRAEFADAA